MKIAMACDHAGPQLKKIIAEHLQSQGHTIDDFGLPDTQERGDYPDYARPAAEAVASGKADLAILICGTGLGMGMAANRIKGIRAATCANEFLARLARAHNNANVLALGARVTGEGLALAIVDVFFKTPFEKGRHETRIAKLDNGNL